MKNLITMMALAAIFTVSITGCKKNNDPEPTAAEKAITSLTNDSSIAWKVSSVTLGGNPVTEYDGGDFTLTLTKSADTAEGEHNYATSNRPDRKQPWPLSGKWELGTSVSSQLVRDPGTADELAMVYTVSDTQLEISFTFVGEGWDQKTDVVEGDWVFTFTK